MILAFHFIFIFFFISVAGDILLCYRQKYRVNVNNALELTNQGMHYVGLKHISYN